MARTLRGGSTSFYCPENCLQTRTIVSVRHTVSLIYMSLPRWIFHTTLLTVGLAPRQVSMSFRKFKSRRNVPSRIPFTTSKCVYREGTACLSCCDLYLIYGIVLQSWSLSLFRRPWLWADSLQKLCFSWCNKVPLDVSLANRFEKVSKCVTFYEGKLAEEEGKCIWELCLTAACEDLAKGKTFSLRTNHVTFINVMTGSPKIE